MSAFGGKADIVRRLRAISSKLHCYRAGRLLSYSPFRLSIENQSCQRSYSCIFHSRIWLRTRRVTGQIATQIPSRSAWASCKAALRAGSTNTCKYQALCKHANARPNVSCELLTFLQKNASTRTPTSASKPEHRPPNANRRQSNPPADTQFACKHCR